ESGPRLVLSIAVPSAVDAVDEARDVLARRAQVGQQPVVERVQLAHGDAALAPADELAGKGFEHRRSPFIGKAAPLPSREASGFSFLMVMALHGGARSAPLAVTCRFGGVFAIVETARLFAEMKNGLQ